MIEGKNVVVAGYARTGQSVVDFLTKRDCSVTVSELQPQEQFPGVKEKFPSVRWEFGGHEVSTFAAADLIILSPGIPDTIPAIAVARTKNIPIVSEIELAFHYLRGTLIGITGTNGKSTTTELTGAMLQAAGKRTFVCGNIGTPLIEFCNNSQPDDFYVIEISSFQLETIRDFRPHIGAILNLAEDHLDRYPAVEPYFAAKMRLLENQTPHDFAVLNFDDPYLRAHAGSVPSNLFWFSRKEIPPSGVYAKEGLIHVLSGMSLVNFNNGKLKGIHNLENTLCAASIAMLCGVRPKAMQQALETFRGLPHRMELVGERDGVRYYDDSKATNVDAVVKSLESFPGNILLIMGGKDKGCDYRVLRELVRSRVKKLILIGEARQRIAIELSDVGNPLFAENLPEAVRICADFASPGDVVLLSPACSSFDMFTDYAERGRIFSEAVQQLQKEPHAGAKQ